jgi:transmembrane sensor
MSIKENTLAIPDEVLDLLAKKALGKLTQPESEALQQWLDNNIDHQEECQRFVDQVKKHYWINLSNNIQQEESQYAALILQKHAARPKKRRLTYSILAYAATLLLFAGLGWYLNNLHKQKPEAPTHTEATPTERHHKAILVLSDGNSLELDHEGNLKMPDEAGVKITNTPGELLRYEQRDNTQHAQKMNTLIVPAGARYQLQLADGTKVWVNAKSSLEYPVAFADNERRVKLNGEAYFEVHPDKNKTFIIEANGNAINVLGTSFNVSAYSEDGFVQTTLVTGAVAIENRQGKVHALQPGQMAMIDNNSQQLLIEKVDTRLYTSWREGILHFNKISLRDLAIKLERWYDVEIHFANQQAANLLFSGAMENSRDISFILRLIGDAAQVEFEIKDKQVIVH